MVEDESLVSQLARWQPYRSNWEYFRGAAGAGVGDSSAAALGADKIKGTRAGELAWSGDEI